MPPDEPNTRPNALRRGPVHAVRGWQWGAFWPAAAAVDLYLRSLRVRFARPEDAARLHDTAQPRVILAWHNRSLVFPVLVRGLPRARVAVLISASRAAAWEAAYFAHRGLTPIRGSTTRGGALALKETIRVLRAGGDVALSPDGPSGPLYSMGPGAARLARRERVAVLLVGANNPRARRLRTWDRHVCPWPGQTVEVRTTLVLPEELAACADDGAAAALLADHLHALNDR